MWRLSVRMGGILVLVLTAALFVAYPSLSSEAIAGHSDIAPGRKSDPWPTFDWPRFRTLLKERLAAQ